MKFETLIGKIVGIVEKASRATGKNLSLPVLSCILLETNKNAGNLTLKSTNLDIGAEFTISVKATESGKVAVPGSIFLNFLSSIGSEGEIKVSENKENLSISFKNNTSTIKCFPKDDFPEIPSVNKEKKARLMVKDFLNGLRSVWFAASVSSIKPELSSVYIYPGNQELIFVATDSFRLAEKKVQYKNPTDFQPVLIPYKNIPDILKILEGLNEEVDVYFDKNQVQISFSQGKIVSRVIDGSFPDYKQIIPKEIHTEATILKQDLIKAIRSAQVFTDAFNQIRFKFDGTKVTLSAKNNDVGEYNETLQSKVSGNPLEISFNYKYILDSLQSIDSESIHLFLSGVGKPMIISGSSDKSFTYIAMPMNK